MYNQKLSFADVPTGVKYFTLTGVADGRRLHAATYAHARAHVYNTHDPTAILGRQRYSHNVMHACRQAAPLLALQRFRMCAFGRVRTAVPDAERPAARAQHSLSSVPAPSKIIFTGSSSGSSVTPHSPSNHAASALIDTPKTKSDLRSAAQENAGNVGTMRVRG